MGEKDTTSTSTFDSVAKGITNDVASASPKEVMLICRETFKGIKDLLAPTLKDLPEKSVFDAEDSLYKIKDEYGKLEDKGNVENEILAEISIIKPKLKSAASQIHTAATIRRGANLAQQLTQNKDEYYKHLPLYDDAVQECYDRVAEINRYIRGLDDIVIKKRDSIDSG